MEPLIVTTTINAPIEKVWELFTNAEHIINWNFAHESWHCPKAENNLEIGGEFFYTMAAKINLQALFFTALTQRLFRIRKLNTI